MLLRQLLRGIKRYTIDMLSLDSMSRKYHVLATNYIFLMIYVTLESVFVNTLLYRITPDISIIILYRGITYVTSAVMMNFAAYIGHKTNPVTVIRLGGALYMLMYLVLFFGMSHMKTLMYVTAALSGIGGAFYWAGHNTLIPYYTNPGNRDIGVSILCIIQGGATLLVPIISGSVISLIEAVFSSPEAGYRVMFGLGMLTVFAQIRYQRKLPPVEHALSDSKIKLALKLFRRNPTFQYILCHEFFRGFRDGTFAFILNMILFEIITSESLVGLNAFLTGITAITGAWVYGKLVTPASRVRYTIIATTAMLLFCATLLLSPSAPVVMLFAMVNSFFALFISNISSNCTIDVLTQNTTCRVCLGETLAIREISLELGRVVGLCLLMLFPANMPGRVSAMLLLTFSQYILAVFVGKSTTILNRKRVKPQGARV